MHHILIVEDAREIYEPLCTLLAEEGFSADVASTQAAAVKLLEDENKKYDLTLIDLILPDGHGFSIFPLAEEKNIPVIFLTATDDEYTISSGLDMGAFDYVCKPYRKKELMSRVRSALRKNGKLNTQIKCGNISVDTAKGIAYKNGQELELTRIEYRLLLVFMNNPDQIILRERLFDEIWDITGEYITDNTLSVHIKRLREKIEDDAQNPTFIQTVRGLGYKVNK